MGLKKGPWTPDEDHKLLSYIEQHGFGNSWRTLPEKAGLERCGKSCRLRWINYLRPDVKRGQFSLQEEQTIVQLHAFLGNRWSAIAAHLPKRTDNEIKNYWNTHIKKRFTKMGIDPTTHKPKSDLLLRSSSSAAAASGGKPTGTTVLSHMAQWERARLEAEARLVRDSKKSTRNINNNNNNKPAGSVVKSRTTSFNASTGSPCLDVLKAWQSVVADMFSISTYNNPQYPSTSTFPIISGSHDQSSAANDQQLLTAATTVRQDDLTVDNNNNGSYHQEVAELNIERMFDNSMSTHSHDDTTFPAWSAAETSGGIGNNIIVEEDFPNFTVHDIDYLIEQGSNIN